MFYHFIFFIRKDASSLCCNLLSTISSVAVALVFIMIKIRLAQYRVKTASCANKLVALSNSSVSHNKLK